MDSISTRCRAFSYPLLAVLLGITHLQPARAQTPASPAAAPAPTVSQPAFDHAASDSLPAPQNGRRSDYTVAPGVTYHYERPKQLRWLVNIPRDLGQFPGYAFRRENVPAMGGILAGSVALWVADEQIKNSAQQFGLFLGLTPKSTQTTLVHIPFHVGSVNLPLEFNVPDNLNSTFYYLGDGWTHLSVATSFWVYGLVKKDNRAAQTATQLGTAILSTGVIAQTLKHITGRQSPYTTTKPRGDWHLFPSYSLYQSHVPNFDAFPTGHLATAMATVTVIAENYPEKKFVRPVGYGLMGLLGFAMLNNGVHWASDYPLGIALGYTMAKIAVRNGRTRVAPKAGSGASGTGWQALPAPKPWYQQVQLAPYNYGPFTGFSAKWRL